MVAQRVLQGQAGAGSETCGVYSFTHAQAHQEHFTCPFGPAQGFARGFARAVLFHTFGPWFGCAVAAGGVESTILRYAPMRAGAKAQIIAVTPVGQVVAAFTAGTCVVGNLVRIQPVCAGNPVRAVIQGGGGVLIGQGERSGAVGPRTSCRVRS